MNLFFFTTSCFCSHEESRIPYRLAGYALIIRIRHSPFGIIIGLCRFRCRRRPKFDQHNARFLWQSNVGCHADIDLMLAFAAHSEKASYIPPASNFCRAGRAPLAITLIVITCGFTINHEGFSYLRHRPTFS
jgi:hypothetical protein